MKDFIKKRLRENLQLADKVYFTPGKLSQQVKEIILRITNGDVYTKLVTDMYWAILQNQHKVGRWAISAISKDSNFEDKDEEDIKNDMLDQKSWLEIRDLYVELKKYNKNVFPIEDLNINGVNNTYQLINALKQRKTIIQEIDKLPSIAKRNLKNDIRTPRNYEELQTYRSRIEYFNGLYSLLGNRDEKLRKRVHDKMFKSETTIDDLIDFADEKENLLGGVNFTKSSIKKIINDNYELETIHENGNIMVVEVSGPQGIKAIGCNSLWCFTYGRGGRLAFNDWARYSTNGIVYAIIDFSKSTDSSDFMYVLIKPLQPEDDDEDADPTCLFDMSNEAQYNPKHILDYMLTSNVVNRLFTFGQEPEEPEPEKEKPFVDPNQLSLFENKKFIKKTIREIRNCQ